jgi:hypothetical protein
MGMEFWSLTQTTLNYWHKEEIYRVGAIAPAYFTACLADPKLEEKTKEQIKIIEKTIYSIRLTHSVARVIGLADAYAVLRDTSENDIPEVLYCVKCDKNDMRYKLYSLDQNSSYTIFVEEQVYQIGPDGIKKREDAKLEEVKEDTKLEEVKENAKLEKVKEDTKLEEVKEDAKLEEVEEDTKPKRLKDSLKRFFSSSSAASPSVIEQDSSGSSKENGSENKSRFFGFKGPFSSKRKLTSTSMPDVASDASIDSPARLLDENTTQMGLYI